VNGVVACLDYNICLDGPIMKHGKPVAVSFMVKESKARPLEPQVLVIQSRPLLLLSTFFWDILPASAIEIYTHF
jgi:hypothetical protein